MNWKPKKRVGKTLYAIDINKCNFNSTSPYGAWTTDLHCPTIVKYTAVMMITNGDTKSTTFIIAKEKKDNEYKAYKLKKINSINEDKQGVVLMKGQNIVISNDKKELLNILTSLYKKKEIAARKAIDEYKTGVFNHYYTDVDWVERTLMAQPKYVMESYKNFVKKLKKI